VNGGVFVGSPLPLLLWVLDVALPPPKRRLWGWRHGTDWLGTQPPELATTLAEAEAVNPSWNT